MNYLASITFLIITFDFCYPACFLSVKDVIPNKGCRDTNDGQVHNFGSSWVSNCLDCSCSEDAVRCCDVMSRPVLIPEDCDMVFDQANCEYKVFKKDNPSVPCKPLAEVGK
ncbi:beta-microseminoprotein-like [Latimeria chalumnae]|uniref:beta-microseminoprotein-like n=1 Tax=Latimeria chalumnae TaxID=7897 RepID=UPI00313C93F3